MTDVQGLSEVATPQDYVPLREIREKQSSSLIKDKSFTFGQPHLVIGNPPYAHFNQLPKETAEQVKRIIGTSEGDIYYAFIIHFINLLQEGGEMIYIVPYHFFYNTYAKVVREHILQNGKIEVIVDLDEARLFSKASPETIIFKFRKGTFNLDNEKMKVIRLRNRNLTPYDVMVSGIKTLMDKKSDEVWDYKEIKHFTTSASWSTHWSSVSIQISRMHSIELGKIAKVGVGPVSGFDKAYRVSEDEFSMLKDNEKALVKKFIKARNCTRYVTHGYHYYILIDDEINESELREKYPNIHLKLMQYKDSISKRYLSNGKSWFHWQALRNYNFLLENLHKKRIYVPVLDRRSYNRFSLGDEYTLPSSDVIFIQPYSDDDIFFLLGYLNSRFFRDYYLSFGGRRGGRVAFTQRILNNIKIPLFNDNIKKEISSITKRIISKIHLKHKIKKEEREIQQIVQFGLFNPS
jgi:adenine-specific DNA-methyltransferase